MTDFSFSHLLDKFDFPGQRLAWPVKKEMNLGKGHQPLLTHLELVLSICFITDITN